jgi:hypothetical protein
MFVLDVAANGGGGCTVVGVGASGAVRRFSAQVTRVVYVRGGSIEAALQRLGCEAKRKEMADEWTAVHYDFAYRALKLADGTFEEAIVQTNDAPTALWLTQDIGAARWTGDPAAPVPQLRCVAVGTSALRAALLVVGADEAPTIVEVASAGELKSAVEAQLRSMRAHVLVSCTHFAGAGAHIDIVDALHWMSVLMLSRRRRSPYMRCAVLLV